MGDEKNEEAEDEKLQPGEWQEVPLEETLMEKAALGMQRKLEQRKQQEAAEAEARDERRPWLGERRVKKEFSTMPLLDAIACEPALNLPPTEKERAMAGGDRDEMQYRKRVEAAEAAEEKAQRGAESKKDWLAAGELPPTAIEAMRQRQQENPSNSHLPIGLQTRRLMAMMAREALMKKATGMPWRVRKSSFMSMATSQVGTPLQEPVQPPDEFHIDVDEL